MGGRGQSSRTVSLARKRGVTVMSEDEFLARRGVGDVLSGYTDDKTRLPHGETLRQRERRLKEGANAANAHYEARKAARLEYKSLVAAGKLRPPTHIESALKTAKGNPDKKAVQAARRVLKKRGIDWRTGKKL